MYTAMQGIVSVLLMAGAGYLLARRGWFDETTARLFARIVVRLSWPCLVVYSLTTRYTRDDFARFGPLILIPYAIIGASYISAFVVARCINVPGCRRGVFQAQFAFANAVFIGLPVCVSLFGDEAVTGVTLYYLPSVTLFWTVGAFFISRDAPTAGRFWSAGVLSRVFPPPIIAFAAAVGLVALGIRLPRFLLDALRYTGDLTTPLSMLFIGTILHSIDMRSIRPDRSILGIAAGRFVITPLIALALVRVLAAPGTVANVFVLEAAMPAITQSAIVAQYYGADSRFATVSVGITTVASLVTIPVWRMVL